MCGKLRQQYTVIWSVKSNQLCCKCTGLLYVQCHLHVSTECSTHQEELVGVAQ